MKIYMKGQYIQIPIINTIDAHRTADICYKVNS